MNAASMRRCALLLGLALLPSCAWSNPRNRPVWNAFEQHLVPDEGALFYVTLPLTVPGGLLALLTDTVIVHPVQVVDDAVADAGELWDENDPDWDDAYYTEMAYLPFRVVFTPVVFAGSFAGRCLFDIPSDDEREADRAARELAREEQREAAVVNRRTAFVAWLSDLHQAPEVSCPGVPEWSDELAAPLSAAFGRSAAVRARIYVELLRAGKASYGRIEVVDGLRDPDPVVRFSTLRHWRGDTPLPPELVESLRSGSSESVRELVTRRARR